MVQPYLELHTGPGRGYPVTQVVARGESVDVLMRRTEWFKVRTERGIEGWASERDLALTTLADGSPFQRQPRRPRRLRLAPLGERRLRRRLRRRDADLRLPGAVADRSISRSSCRPRSSWAICPNGYLVDIGFSHVFMPEWRFSPFVTLGGGYERVEPKATLAQPVSSSNQTAYSASACATT